MQALYRPSQAGEGAEVLAVFFDAGARTVPHIHDNTQVLQVISGRCLVVIESERHVASPGDFLVIPGGVWHWHGATREGAACHISIRPPAPTQWDVPRRDWAAG